MDRLRRTLVMRCKTQPSFVPATIYKDRRSSSSGIHSLIRFEHGFIHSFRQRQSYFKKDSDNVDQHALS